MARRKLSLKDQLKGVQAAARSARTPPQLRQGLRERAMELKRLIKLRSERQKSFLERLLEGDEEE